MRNRFLRNLLEVVRGLKEFDEERSAKSYSNCYRWYRRILHG